jgi:predicted nucleotidyltransferase
MKKGLSHGEREEEGRDREDRHRAMAVWERALHEERQEREQDRQRWLSRAKEELINFFRGKQVDKVYLCGSVLREDCFYPFSDIDLAVEGLREDYFTLLVDLEECMGRWVDVIELEKCRFREQIERQGVRIQ